MFVCSYCSALTVKECSVCRYCSTATGKPALSVWSYCSTVTGGKTFCLQLLFYSDRKKPLCLQLLFYSDSKTPALSVCSYGSAVTGKACSLCSYCFLLTCRYCSTVGGKRRCLQLLVCTDKTLLCLHFLLYIDKKTPLSAVTARPLLENPALSCYYVLPTERNKTYVQSAVIVLHRQIGKRNPGP